MSGHDKFPIQLSLLEVYGSFIWKQNEKINTKSKNDKQEVKNDHVMHLFKEQRSHHETIQELVSQQNDLQMNQHWIGDSLKPTESTSR